MSENLDRSFGFLLHDIARLLRKRYEQRARPFGLTRAQWQILAHLQRHEGINQSGLAEIIEIEPVTVGRLVDRMAAAGWVERRADPGDRRAHRLFLTERARPMLERCRTLAEDLRGEAFSGLSDGERETLTALLVHIRSNLSDRSGERKPAAAPAAVALLETVR
jgi:DNA-binding MarR family transcriptional regulator